MRPDVKVVFRFGAILGFSPFGVCRDGQIFFKWKSFRVAYFLFILTLTYACLGYSTYVTYKAYLQYSLSGAFNTAGWIPYFFVASLVFTMVLLQRNSLIYYFNIAGQIWDKNDDQAKMKTIQSSQRLFYVWAFLGFILSASSNSYHQYEHPEIPVYFNNILGYHDANMPLLVRLICIIANIYVVLICFGAMLLSDYLATSIAFSYKVSFVRINEALLSQFSKEIEANFLSHYAASSKLNQVHPVKGAEMAQVTEEMRGIIFERAMNKHYTNQYCLKVFNRTFASFILLFLLQCFVVSICLFFVIFTKIHTLDTSTLLIYMVNGIQFIVRCATLLHIMGSVRTAAGGIKDIVVKDIGLGEVAHNPALMHRLNLFLQDCTNVGVEVGEYVSLTPGFLMSFFGALITYLAILVQSL